jgi:DNA ligase (NAD+)
MYTGEQIKALQQQTTELLGKVNQKKISKEDIDVLREVLRFHEYRYYILNDPLVADQEYDLLYKALEKIEKEDPSLIAPDVVAGE